MIIPKEIEDAIKLKEQQKFCAQLCADIPELIVENLNKPSSEQASDEVGADFIVESIRNEINRRVDRYGVGSKLNLTDMPCAVSRPNVGIFHLESNKFISSSDDLIDLFRAVEEVKIEKKYTGPDKNTVTVLRARLPEGYVACCAYVQARHIPANIFEEDRVVAKLIKNKLGQVVDVDLLCRDIPPLRSTEAYGYMSAEKVKLHYHWVTVKINKETKTLQCWFPGIERNVADGGRPKDMVLVGAHYKKIKRQAKPYGGFGTDKSQD
jgi:hypothetical protein